MSSRYVEAIQSGRRADQEAAARLGWRTPLEDYLRSVRGTLAAGTEAYYRERLGILLRWVRAREEAGEAIPLEDFHARHMRAFMEARAASINPQTKRPLSDNTRRSDAIVAKTFLSFCAEQGYIAKNPLKDYKVIKPAGVYVPVPTEEEGTRVLAAVVDRWNPVKNPPAARTSAARRTFFARRNAALIGGLIQTGCRISELLALTTADYQPERKLIVIRESKGKRPREVPLEDAWIKMVQSYMVVRPKRSPTDFLFVTDAGEQMCVGNFRKQWYADLRFGGLPRYTLHSIRHFSLTCLAETNKWGAQQIAGHKDGKTTDIYLSRNQKHLHEVMEAAAPLSRLLVNVRSEKAKRKRLV